MPVISVKALCSGVDAHEIIMSPGEAKKPHYSS